MADVLRYFFIDASSTKYSYMFQYALSSGETPENPTSCVVVGWNPSEIGPFISVGNDMHLFIPEVVKYNGTEVRVVGIYDEAFVGFVGINPNPTEAAEATFNCNHIKTVHLPNGITNIGTKAFGACTSLVYINLPETLTNIGSYAFSRCSNLQTKTADGVSDAPTPGYLHIPGNVESITDAFTRCESLTLVEIGGLDHNNGSNLHDNAFSFSDCTNLKTFRCFVKSGEVTISDYCFENCTNLTTVEFPLSVISSIGNYAFAGCQNLTTITQVGPVINSLTGDVMYNSSEVTIGSEAFKNCTSLFRFPLQSDIISLGANAFQGCYYLQEINLGSSLTEIPEGAFDGCSSLGTITIPKNCTRIDNNAFNACVRLRDVFIISLNLEYIGDAAFSGCTNLQRLWLMASNYNGITFSGSPFGDYTVNPNKSLILNSAFTQGWDESNFAAFETTFNTYWQVSATRETILSTPPISSNPNELTFILELNRPTIDSLTGTATLTGIINQNAIETSIINLPESVTFNGRTYTINKIGDDTFAYNYRISKISIPASITEIGNRAFESCCNLEEISGPNVDNFPITKIGNGAFAFCGKLSKINNANNILNNLQYVGKDAFVCCNSLGKINLGTNYDGPIPERAFAHCGNLRVSKKSTTTYIEQPTSTRYNNTTFFGTTLTFVNI